MTLDAGPVVPAPHASFASPQRRRTRVTFTTGVCEMAKLSRHSCRLFVRRRTQRKLARIVADTTPSVFEALENRRLMAAQPLVQLANAATDQTISAMTDGMTIDTGVVGTALSITAQPAGKAGSVVFKLDGKTVSTETYAPVFDRRRRQRQSQRLDANDRQAHAASATVCGRQWQGDTSGSEDGGIHRGVVAGVGHPVFRERRQHQAGSDQCPHR